MLLVEGNENIICAEKSIYNKKKESESFVVKFDCCTDTVIRVVVAVYIVKLSHSPYEHHVVMILMISAVNYLSAYWRDRTSILRCYNHNCLCLLDNFVNHL